MYLDAAVIAYKTQFAKAIHKEADPGPSGTDHICQRFLSNVRNIGFVSTWFPELGHQQEDPRKAFFAGIEELIDKIGLGSHAARQQEFEEQVGKCRFVMHHANHFASADFERCAGVNRGSGGHAQSLYGRKRLLSNKIECGQQSDCGLFAVLRYDGDSCAAFLEVKDRIRGIALAKKGLLWLQFDDCPAKSGICKKCGGIEFSILLSCQASFVQPWLFVRSVDALSS